MAEKLNCECCGMWTRAGKEYMRKRALAHPIYGTDLTAPLSQTIEKLRSQLAQVRGQLGDISSAFPVWGERTKDVEGLLTCGLVALHSIKEEMRKFELQQAANVAQPKEPA